MAENDLAKIVGLIMENPKLIEEIKNLSAKAGTAEEMKAAAESETAETNGILLQEEVKPPEEKNSRIRRRELLSALKPYVSEERGKAIDSVMSIADILEVMRSK